LPTKSEANVLAIPCDKHLNMTILRIARAVDIGFGFNKLSQSMIDEHYDMSALAFPSFPSPVEGHADIADGVMHRLQVVTVDVDGVRYLVGPDSMVAASGRQPRTATNAFFTSPQYMALYLGALAYMNLPAGANTIHVLGAGLPLTVWRDAKLRAEIKARMTGTFTVPVPDSTKTREITVERVELWPQVLGGLVSISTEDGDLALVANQNNLVVDVGYGTLLWMATAGMKPQIGRSDGTNGGVSSMLKAVARMVDPALVNDPRTLDRIDNSLRTGEPLMINGTEVDLELCKTRADAQALQHLQELLDSIGTHKNFDNIFVAGGGAHLYSHLIAKQFAGRKIRTQTNEPQFANLKGMQQLAEQILAQ
jgi:plasmid segregation protein ParM